MAGFLRKAFIPLIYLVVGFSFLPGAKIHAQTEADFFEEVFGRGPSNQDRHLSVPLIADDKHLGDIMVILSDDPSDLQVDATMFLEKVQPLVDPEVMRKIRSAPDESGTVKLKIIQDSGLEALFDQNTVELRLQIPPELRTTAAASLQGSSPVIRGQLVQPSPFSAYCNIYAEQSYLYQDVEEQTAGRQPLGLRFEGAFNVFGLVLESGVSFTEDADYPWQLGETRLVLDDVAHSFRYSLGQIVYPVTGFQRVVPLLGFSLAKNLALQPYRLSRPQGETEFFLKNPSTVEVVVNGKLIKTLQLPAGPHSLKGFSFYNGTNDLVLRITDNFGREEELKFPFFFDSELLRFGGWQFSGAVGFPAGMERGLPSVELQVPTASLLGRFALSNTVTVGANIQGNTDQQMLGVAALWAGPLGVIKAEIAGSTVESVGSDLAARLKYRYYNAGARNRWNRLWTLAAEYMGPSFAALGNLNPVNDYPFSLSAGYSQGLPWGMGLNLGGSYNLGLGGIPDFIRLNLGLRKSIKGGHSLSLYSNCTITENSLTDWSLLVGYTFRSLSTQHSFKTEQTMPAGKASYSWQYSPKNGAGGIGSSVEVYGDPDSYSFSGKLSYANYFLESSVYHETTPLILDQDNVIHHESHLSLASALLFSGGRLGLSRPVRDSFVMVVPHPNLKKYPIGVNPVGDKYSARTGFLFPAVLPNLSSYNANSFMIDVPNIPLGYEMGSEEYTFIPRYKSAALVTVGTDAKILLGGTLQAVDGTPVSLQAGQIVSLNDPDWEARLLFTGKKGQFRVEGIKPGTYKIQLFKDLGAVEFEVASGKEGFYDLGTLELNAVQ